MTFCDCPVILAFIKYVYDLQITGLLWDVALSRMVGVKPSVGGELNHQTFSCFRQDMRLLEDDAIADRVRAHQNFQLVR